MTRAHFWSIICLNSELKIAWVNATTKERKRYGGRAWDWLLKTEPGLGKYISLMVGRDCAWAWIATKPTIEAAWLGFHQSYGRLEGGGRRTHKSHG